MANSKQTLNLEQINEIQVRPEEVDLEVVKGKISEFLEKSQNLSNAGMDSLLDEVNKYLVSNLENLHVNNRLKENHPFLDRRYKNKSKYPRLYKLYSKRIEKLVNKYKKEYRENHRSIDVFELMEFVTNKKKNNNNFREIELLQHIQAVILLSKNYIEESNIILKDNIITTLKANIQRGFNTENLKNLLSNPNTTIKNLEETADLLLPKNSEGKRLNLPNEFLQEQKNNIEKLEEELGNKETLEKSKYNYYANIYYLKSFIAYDDTKHEGVNANAEYKEANELLDKGNFYSFYSNKENLQKFIEDNCFKPDVLYKKICDLQLFYDKCFDKEKRKTVFNILYNNTKSIEKKFKDSGEKLAALNFFKMNLLFGIGTNEETTKDYIECKKGIENYYFKSENENDKITGLSVINIFKNDLGIEQNEKLAKKLFSSLSKLTENKEAQYECGKYIKNEDKNKAFEYFKNSADKGHNEAKVEVAGYYIEEYNQAKEESTKEDRRKDIEAIISTLPEEFNEKKAEIYEKIDSYKEAGECYEKLMEEADNKKNYMDNVVRLKKFFIKIGDCFTKFADKIRGKNNNVNNEESKNYYKKANENYVNSGSCNSDKVPAISEVFKIAVNYKKLGLHKEYEYQLKLVENSLQNLKEDEKIHLVDLYFELANFYYTGGINRENININKAYEYYREAVEFGCEEATVKFLYVLAEAEGNGNFNEKEIFNISKKLTTPEAKYEVALKLRLKYKDLAFNLFKEAANSGNEKAKYEVAKMLKYGKGTKQNEKEAIKLFEELIKSEDKAIVADSSIMLGDIYSKRNSNKLSDIEKIVNFYREGINLKLRLDMDYKDDELDKKLEFYTYKLKSIKDNDLTAKFKIAEMYREGIGIEKNEEEAIKLFKELAKNKDVGIKQESIIALVDIFVKQKNKKELESLIKSCGKDYLNNKDLENKIRLAKFTVANIYLGYLNKAKKEGKNKNKLEQNVIKSFEELVNDSSPDDEVKWKSLGILTSIYEKIWNKNKIENRIELDNSIDYLTKYINLYTKINNGKIVKKSIRDKLDFLNYNRAALFDNNQTANFEVARMYRDGIGVEKNENLAIKSFEFMANQSTDQSVRIESLIALGDIFAIKSDSESLKKAKEYYCKANNICKSVDANSKEIEIKQKILEFNNDTEENDIKEAIDNMTTYLKEIAIGIKEKEKKFEMFTKILLSKVNESKKSIINDMLKASNEFFTNSINSVNK